MSTETKLIEITAEQARILSDWSARTGLSPQDVLANALRQYHPENGESPAAVETATNDEETVYEAFFRHGVIGCIKGGPPDVSTNPKYMEGFGKRGQ